jgi:hypothetical protein
LSRAPRFVYHPGAMSYSSSHSLSFAPTQFGRVLLLALRLLP